VNADSLELYLLRLLRLQIFRLNPNDHRLRFYISRLLILNLDSLLDLENRGRYPHPMERREIVAILDSLAYVYVVDHHHSASFTYEKQRIQKLSVRICSLAPVIDGTFQRVTCHSISVLTQIILVDTKQDDKHYPRW
jgi:hypothetical protein